MTTTEDRSGQQLSKRIRQQMLARRDRSRAHAARLMAPPQRVAEDADDEEKPS